MLCYGTNKALPLLSMLLCVCVRVYVCVWEGRGLKRFPCDSAAWKLWNRVNPLAADPSLAMQLTRNTPDVRTKLFWLMMGMIAPTVT